MESFPLTANESEAFRFGGIRALVPLLYKKPKVVFATAQQLHAEQNANRVESYLKISNDNYALLLH